MTRTCSRHLVVVAALALPPLLGACSLCQQQREQQAQAIEPVLAAAGFDVWMADTPEKLTHLKQMPAMRLVPQRQGGKLYYGFADPYVCKCLYVGTAEDYAQYQKLKGQQAVANTETSAHLLEADAEGQFDLGESYWGPFGPFE